MIVPKQIFWIIGAFSVLMVAHIHAESAEGKSKAVRRGGRPKRNNAYFALSPLLRDSIKTDNQNKLKPMTQRILGNRQGTMKKRNCFDWWCFEGKATDPPLAYQKSGTTLPPGFPPGDKNPGHQWPGEQNPGHQDPLTTRSPGDPIVHQNMGTTLPQWFNRGGRNMYDNRKGESRPKRRNAVYANRPMRTSPLRDLMENGVLIGGSRNNIIEKRDCFDWWCFDDKATSPPPDFGIPVTTLPPGFSPGNQGQGQQNQDIQHPGQQNPGQKEPLTTLPSENSPGHHNPHKKDPLSTLPPGNSPGHQNRGQQGPGTTLPPGILGGMRRGRYVIDVTQL